MSHSVMIGRSAVETELGERIGWLISLRWLAVLGTGLGVALGWLWAPGSLPLIPLAVVVLAIAVYNLQFLLYARTLPASAPEEGSGGEPRSATRFAYFQIVVDLVALATLIHFSGGVESPASLFFVFHTILASILLSRRVSFLMATLGAALYALVAALEYLQVLRHYHLPILWDADLYNQGPYVLTAVATMAVTLWLVAYLTTSVSVKLRQRDLELVGSHRALLVKSRELEAANERLWRLDAERTRFITLVTHELRAPIGTIHTCVEVALGGYASPEKVREILERTHRRTAELLELIGDLLRLARARAEAIQEEQLQLVQPGEILLGLVDLFRTEAAKKDLFLSVDAEPDLAPVRANADRFKLVWTNLLSNAIKYTEPGGIVAVALKQSEDQLIGTVRDTGIGIARDEQKRILEEFYRAENAREICPTGTGVGLAIIQRILENWGGTLLVESELGLGSKFTFVLPRADL